jgi:hypothetical protein
LLYQWWFIKRGAEFRPQAGGVMEAEFRQDHPKAALGEKI